jgi:NAD(P)H-dependent flavin oxidoreductase YrpB (nitropropane dioxygenase family)
MQTDLTRLLGIDAPIVQGSFGPWTSVALSAAVSEAGGLGSIGTALVDPARVAAMIAEMRERTSRPFAVNHTWRPLSEEAFQVTLDARPAVISLALGGPGDLPARAHAAGVRFMARVHTVEQAVRAAEAGTDIVIAQGAEAGGFGGEVSTMALVPQVVDAVAPVPVLAAGGIADGRGLAAALALGAQGVNIGIRFLAAAEADIPDGYKAAIVAAASQDGARRVRRRRVPARVRPGPVRHAPARAAHRVRRPLQRRAAHRRAGRQPRAARRDAHRPRARARALRRADRGADRRRPAGARDRRDDGPRGGRPTRGGFPGDRRGTFRRVKLLVLATEPVDADRVRGALPDDDLEGAEVLVVSPAVNESAVAFWMSDSDEAIADAESTAESTAAQLRERGAHARSTTGESEPLLALQDALATFDADRVVVFVRDEDASRYREDDVVGEAERRFGVPVTEVTT